MAAPPLHDLNTSGADALIAGAYQVEAGSPLNELGGGQPCFAVRDHKNSRSDLMAVQVAVDAPLRGSSFISLVDARIENLLLPVAHGRGTLKNGQQHSFVITTRPLGSSVWMVPKDEQRVPWSEAELLSCLIRPVVTVLEQLRVLAFTHRAIRPNNVFRVGSGSAVTLGCAWASPPAMLQSPVFEPPYIGFAHPAGRGEGLIADDVYALGVLLIALATGKMPMSGLDDATILQRKIDLGSYAAVVGDLRLPPLVADLARGMLAEDPEHRPPPSLLADPMAARARRVAARPPARAPKPLEVGGKPVFDLTMLAYAMAENPEEGIKLIHNGGLDFWVRRVMNNNALAQRLEEPIRNRAIDSRFEAGKADNLMLMYTIIILDHLAPMCWGGLFLFPDGLPALMAYVGPSKDPKRIDIAGKIDALISVDGMMNWLVKKGIPPNTLMLAIEPMHMRAMLTSKNGWAGGEGRLRYALNPLLACRSPLLGPFCVVRVVDLLPALERQIVSGADVVIDQEIGTFIAARFTGVMDIDLRTLSQAEDPALDAPGHYGIAQLRVLSRLESLYNSARWPNLSAAAAGKARHALKRWRQRSERSAREARLAAAVEMGSLAGMLDVLEDVKGLANDAVAARLAENQIAIIEANLAALSNQDEDRSDRSRAVGQEIAAAIGLMALAGGAVIAVIF